MKIRKDLQSLIYSDKDVLNGTPCFIHTRVPVALVLDFLSRGWSVDDLKKKFPTVQQSTISELLRRMSDNFKPVHA